jgi:hypothetical protein
MITTTTTTTETDLVSLTESPESVTAGYRSISDAVSRFADLERRAMGLKSPALGRFSGLVRDFCFFYAARHLEGCFEPQFTEETAHRLDAVRLLNVFIGALKAYETATACLPDRPPANVRHLLAEARNEKTAIIERHYGRDGEVIPFDDELYDMFGALSDLVDSLAGC